MNDSMYLAEDFFDGVLFDIPNTKSVPSLNNESYITVLHHEQDIAQTDLLQKILGACNINFNSETLLITASDNEVLALSSILEINSQRVIVFGEMSKVVSGSWQIPLNTLVNLHDKEWLFTSSLIEISTDQNAKKELWKAIQHWKKP